MCGSARTRLSSCRESKPDWASPSPFPAPGLVGLRGRVKRIGFGLLGLGPLSSGQRQPSILRRPVPGKSGMRVVRCMWTSIAFWADSAFPRACRSLPACRLVAALRAPRGEEKLALGKIRSWGFVWLIGKSVLVACSWLPRMIVACGEIGFVRLPTPAYRPRTMRCSAWSQWYNILARLKSPPNAPAPVLACRSFFKKLEEKIFVPAKRDWGADGGKFGGMVEEAFGGGCRQKMPDNRKAGMLFRKGRPRPRDCFRRSRQAFPFRAGRRRPGEPWAEGRGPDPAGRA